jgi:hypothetical protein
MTGKSHVPVPWKLGFRLKVKSRKGSSGSVLKSHKFSSNLGCAPAKVEKGAQSKNSYVSLNFCEVAFPVL